MTLVDYGAGQHLSPSVGQAGCGNRARPALCPPGLPEFLDLTGHRIVRGKTQITELSQAHQGPGGLLQGYSRAVPHLPWHGTGWVCPQQVTLTPHLLPGSCGRAWSGHRRGCEMGGQAGATPWEGETQPVRAEVPAVFPAAPDLWNLPEKRLFWCSIRSQGEDVS